MSLNINRSFLVVLVIVYSLTSCDGTDIPVLLSAEGAGPVGGSAPVFKPAAGSVFSVSLLSAVQDGPELSDFCSELLRVFGQRYVAFIDCLVPAARPVTVCQSCFSTYGGFLEAYTNISSEQVRDKSGGWGGCQRTQARFLVSNSLVT